MNVQVLATGVALSLATADEILVIRRLDAGLSVDLAFAYRFAGGRKPDQGEAYAVAQGFVEFEADGDDHQWVGSRHLGAIVPLRDPSLDLLVIADHAWADDALGLLADMRIAGYRVTRWAFMSAPHRLEVDEPLASRI